MNQTVYILILVSLLILFLINKYEREKLQKILQEQLLKDEAFKASIKEQIQTMENINDVIHAINKDYRLGLLLSKDITDQLKLALKEESYKIWPLSLQPQQIREWDRNR